MVKPKEITVTVKFFATLREFGPIRETIKIPKNSTVKTLFERYKVPFDKRRTIILINGKSHQDQHTVLKDGDLIAIFPPLAGGGLFLVQ
ncbi:MAG: MoaD/ThiS family protein [Candidatus Helarchaeota archaeon]